MHTLIFTPYLFAQEYSETKRYKAHTVQNHLNLRMGFSTATTNSRPTICIEGVVSKQGTVEACGTGYGFLHRELGIDFVHFRGKWRVYQQQFPHSQFTAHIGAGFAEIQLGEDQLGFVFTENSEGIETAGPELALSMQWHQNIGKNTDLIIDLNGGAAYFHHGPSLMVPQTQFFPFLELSAGLGW